MDRQRNSLFLSAASSLMLGAALVPGGHGYAAAGAVDLPAAVKQLTGAGWVGSAMSVDQAAREVPMPEGILLGAPKQVAALTTPSFQDIVTLLEKNGKASRMSRLLCSKFYDAPAGDGLCAVREYFTDEGEGKRNISVLIEAGTGETRVSTFYKDKATGVIHAYGLTRDGQLKRAYRFENKTFTDLDIAAVAGDTSPKGISALMSYWAGKESVLRSPWVGPPAG